MNKRTRKALGISMLALSLAVGYSSFNINKSSISTLNKVSTLSLFAGAGIFLFGDKKDDEGEDEDDNSTRNPPIKRKPFGLNLAS